MASEAGIYRAEQGIYEQVDILISKNQALQILYLKHITLHKLPWIETHENLISTKLNIYTVQFIIILQ